MLAVVPLNEEKAVERAVPVGLDPPVTRREIVIEADAETLEKMCKEGQAKVHDNVFTMDVHR